MIKEQKLTRIGATCAVLVVLIVTVSAMIGPRDLDFGDIHSVLQTCNANVGQ